MACRYFVVTLGVYMQVLPHAQLQRHESGCVEVGETEKEMILKESGKSKKMKRKQGSTDYEKEKNTETERERKSEDRRKK